MSTASKILEIVNEFNSGPKGREEIRNLTKQLEAIKAADPQFADAIKELRISNPKENLKVKECILQALLHVTKLVAEAFEDVSSKAKVADSSFKDTANRTSVFQYLDDQVHKDMTGFYDALGRVQPLPAKVRSASTPDFGHEHWTVAAYKDIPSKIYVRQNFCRCHPETCCCDDWAVHLPSGKKYTTRNSKEAADDLAEWLNKQLDGQSNERP